MFLILFTDFCSKTEKAPTEKTAEVLQLEEFLFGKDIINASSKETVEDIEV